MHSSTFTALLHRVVSTQPDPPYVLVICTGVLALAGILPMGVWRITRHVVTLVHEAGHSIVAILAGRRLSGIRLHSDTSGLSVSVGRPNGFGMVMTSLAGYIAPSLVGLLGAAMLALGYVTALLWGFIGVLAVMLVMIRNAFGVVSVVVTGALMFAVSWFTTAEIQSLFAYLFVWFLLLGGVRPIFELARKRRWGRLPDSDADQLARLTRVPAVAWVVVFTLVAVVAVLVGAHFLLGARLLDSDLLAAGS